MFKAISEESLYIAIDFAWELSQKPESSSYPMYKDKNQLEDNFKRWIKKNDTQLLGYYINNQLIAVVSFFSIDNEKYIQSTGIFISSKYNEVMDKLISMIKIDFTGYKCLFGFPKENIDAYNYFTKKGYECIDSCLDMRLNTTELIITEHNNDVYKIYKKDFDSYALFHDKSFTRTYWTSERLRENLDDWRIFIYKYDGNIEGSIFIKYCNKNTVEIFGVSVTDKCTKKRIEEKLISQSLEMVFIENSFIENAILFIDDCENERLEMIEKLGFKYFSSYCCYQGLL